jgi:tetratricopeptide (TPR) repeat protein
VAASVVSDHPAGFGSLTGTGVPGASAGGEHRVRALQLDESIAQIRQLLETDPTSAGYRRSLARYLTVLFRIQLETARKDSALSSLDEMIALAQHILEADSSSNENLLFYAQSLVELARAQFAEGPSESIVNALDVAIALTRKHLEDDLNGTEALIFLAHSLVGFSLSRGAGSPDEAIAALDEAIALTRDLLDAEPHEPRRGAATGRRAHRGRGPAGRSCPRIGRSHVAP